MLIAQRIGKGKESRQILQGTKYSQLCISRISRDHGFLFDLDKIRLG